MTEEYLVLQKIFLCFQHFVSQNHYQERAFMAFWMYNACELCRLLSAERLQNQPTRRQEP